MFLINIQSSIAIFTEKKIKEIAKKVIVKDINVSWFLCYIKKCSDYALKLLYVC